MSLGVSHKKAKGVAKSAVRTKIVHQMYKDVLFQQKEILTLQKSIRSFNHELFTIEMNKRSLSPFDDKRWICDDGIHTLAFGHFSLRNQLAPTSAEEDQ